MNIVKKDVINSLKKGETILLHGPLGVGKTFLIKEKIMPKLKNHTFYLSCPLEPEEFINVEFGIKNNPKNNIILDNIEDADKGTIQKLIKLLNKKPKETIVISICTNIYDQHLKTVKTKFDKVLKMPILQIGDAVIYAEKNGANDKTIELISKRRPTDYRQLQNMMNFETDHACLTKNELHTFIGFKNCFKTFEWLLGAKNNANLYEIVQTDPYFYQNSLFENYVTHIKTIQDASNFTEELSISNTFIEQPEFKDNMTIRLKSTIQTPTKFNTKFPRYFYFKSFNKIIPTQEHYDTLHTILNMANVSKPKKEILDRVRVIVKYYKLTPEYIEKCLTNSLLNKKIKMKVNLKRAIQSS